MSIEDQYVSQLGWLAGRGRADLVDIVADEYEFHPARAIAARSDARAESEAEAA
jgi:hypothetical protein